MISTTIIGRLGNDPRMYDTANGGSLAQFSVAVTVPRYRVISKDPASETDTCWVSCVALGDTADYLEAHAFKGSTVKVEGYLQESHYTDANGSLHRGLQLRALFVTAQGGGSARAVEPEPEERPRPSRTARAAPAAAPRAVPRPRTAAAPVPEDEPEERPRATRRADPVELDNDSSALPF